jgi:excisionase family DNA binding protein
MTMQGTERNTVMRDRSELRRWLSTGAAAHRLGCSPQWIRELIHLGQLRAIRTSIGNLIDPASVDEYLDSRGGSSRG